MGFRSVRRVRDHIDIVEPNDHNYRVDNWIEQASFNERVAQAFRNDYLMNLIEQLKGVVSSMTKLAPGDYYYAEHHNRFVDAWELQHKIDDAMAQFIPGNASGLDPNDSTWSPSRGWDSVWEFNTLNELRNFANYSIENATVENSQLVIAPPTNSSGRAYRILRFVPFARVAVALKIDAYYSDPTIPLTILFASITPLWKYGIYKFFWEYLYLELEPGDPNKLRISVQKPTPPYEIYKTFNNPNDWIVFSTYLHPTEDYVVMKVYDRRKNVLASLSTDLNEADYTHGELEIATIGGWANVYVDWVAIRYELERIV